MIMLLEQQRFLNLVKSGPDLTYLGDVEFSTMPSYFSSSWYTSSISSAT